MTKAKGVATALGERPVESQVGADRVILELTEVEAKVLMEALGIQLRATADTGRPFLHAIRDRLIALMVALPADPGTR